MDTRTEQKKCGCHIGNLHGLLVASDTLTIEYCPLHAAAPQLVEALKRAYGLEKANHGMTSHAYAYQQAIATVEGR